MSRWSFGVLAGAALAASGLSTAAFSEESVPLAEVAHIHGVGFDPKDPSRVLLATHFGVIVATGDGMATPLSVTSDDFMGFTTVPGRSDLLVASGHPGTGRGNMGFITSEDGGVTWRQVSEGSDGPVDFHALTVSPANPDVLYGLYHGIQVSRDGGRTWGLAGAGPAAVIDLAASSVDENMVFAATGAGLYRSTDGAETWELVGPVAPMTMVEAGPDGTVYAFVAGNGLYSLNPAAEQWTALNESLGGQEFLHMAADGSVEGHLVAATHASEVLESRDGGRTWAPYGTPR
ncbi:MAG: exo-alpha-sialidase [Devosia nanyangense]|uniref:Exo-alpha-sialidase n=1 Tax=Devosia nanyangense TaxID=1228055 RepID=A0A933L3A1_9HYPH|nr:exo-alpha-sialidase [Devosia nanyangense]